MNKFQNVLLGSAILLSIAASPGVTAASGLDLNPAVWKLAVNQDFTKGDAPGLYETFCGAQGGANGTEINNFSKQNVYWDNGALTLRFERRTNTSCTSITRDYAGAGFIVNTPAATSIAAEFEILGTDVHGVSPYATLWPAGTVKPSCGWGAEDDFFEQDARTPGHEVQTYHHWTPACIHQHHQAFQSIPDIAATYHTYSVVRDGGTTFFFDGRVQTFSNGQSISTDDFQDYPMAVHIGVGGKNSAMPDDSHLPAYVRIRHIKVWYKNE